LKEASGNVVKVRGGRRFELILMEYTMEKISLFGGSIPGKDGHGSALIGFQDDAEGGKRNATPVK